RMVSTRTSNWPSGFGGRWSLLARFQQSSQARMPQMKTILFLCTGNYYRSRYAEILFNWKAKESGLAWEADSRGLDPHLSNPGPMSRHTMSALGKLGIPFEKHLR